MPPYDENSERVYQLRLSLFEAMDRYLDDEARVSFGTGTAVPEETEPLPPLRAGEPLYDATKALIKAVWGADNRMPPEGMRLWNHLLRASRRHRLGGKIVANRLWGEANKAPIALTRCAESGSGRKSDFFLLAPWC
jgi:hypothetical protein